MGKKKDAKADGKGLRKATDRRQFLKVAGIGGLSAASLYLLGCAAEAVTTTVTAPGTTTTVTGPGVTTTVTAPGTTATVTTGPGTTVTTTAPGVTTTVTATVAPEEITWDYEADVVIIGSGAMGMPSAIRARDAGASVIVVEQNFDVGGRVINSGGVTCIGGGDWLQTRENITVYDTNEPDSAEVVFRDMVDWSAVRSDGLGTYRYNDRDQMRWRADNSVATRQFLTDNGVMYPDPPAVGEGSHGGVGISAPRRARGEMEGMSTQSPLSPVGSAGSAQLRPMEASARAKGVQFMMNRYMTEIYRETPTSGRVLGISASYTPRFLPSTPTVRMESYRSEGNIDERRPTVNIKANKAVIIATSGGQSDVPFRRMYDPRLGDQCQKTNEPYTGKRGSDGSGIKAAIRIGAGLWSVFHNYEHNGFHRKRTKVGLQHAYHSIEPESPVWEFARSRGVNIPGAGWQSVINVTQMGKRFYNESLGTYPSSAASPPGRMPWSGIIPVPYVQWDWRNCSEAWVKENYERSTYIDAALMMNEGSTAGNDWSAGPVWAIFDAAAVTRHEINIEYPRNSDSEFWFTANTIAELATKINTNPFQHVPMPAANLEGTIARYNGFVDSGVDSDFGKPTMFKVDTPPFYAGYSSVMVHDFYGGVRINGKGQVYDIEGEIIPSLYSGGEASGGAEQHGLGRIFIQGYIAGNQAAQEPSL